MISDQIRQHIRDIPDFPKPGILFKDITPLLKHPHLCNAIADEFANRVAGLQVDALAGIESRGFLFGLMLAAKLNIPFIPVRKQGKLPYKTLQQPCELEYGSAVLEMHEDAISAGQRVLIHDDLLATGGTVGAACRLVQQSGGRVAGCCFIIGLDFLGGKDKLNDFTSDIVTLVEY